MISYGVRASLRGKSIQRGESHSTAIAGSFVLAHELAKNPDPGSQSPTATMSSSTTPRPYLALDAPHSDLCLTDYLPTDAAQMSRILSDVSVAVHLTGPPFPLTVADANWWIDGRQTRIESGQEVGGFIGECSVSLCDQRKRGRWM